MWEYFLQNSRLYLHRSLRELWVVEEALRMAEILFFFYFCRRSYKTSD